MNSRNRFHAQQRLIRASQRRTQFLDQRQRQNQNNTPETKSSESQLSTNQTSSRSAEEITQKYTQK